MRILIFFLVLTCLNVPSTFCADEMGFDSFIKSREVVATLYFQENSEDLAKGEHDHILETISQLRKLQNDGRMIRVEGFSSPEGDKETNFILSFFRARAVADIIEAKGLPAVVTLTGYGDLRAISDDPNKERRVEIASYIKPVSTRKIRIADRKEKITPISQPGITRTSLSEESEIDSLTVDRAIRQKITTKQQKLADKQFADERKKYAPEFSPSISRIPPPQDFIIDALAIEQAIMEKIGAEPSIPSDAVSQIGLNFKERPY